MNPNPNPQPHSNDDPGRPQSNSLPLTPNLNHSSRCVRCNSLNSNDNQVQNPPQMSPLTLPPIYKQENTGIGSLHSTPPLHPRTIASTPNVTPPPPTLQHQYVVKHLKLFNKRHTQALVIHFITILILWIITLLLGSNICLRV